MPAARRRTAPLAGLATATWVEGRLGVTYTTWENDYRDLEAFAREWWGGRP